MTPERVLQIQQHLNVLGFGPLDEDGIYGPATAAAYDRYLDTVPGDTETPPPAIPWYLSRAVVGAVATIGVSIAGALGVILEAEATTELAMSIITVVTGGLAWYGSIKRVHPIDPTLVLPGVRLPAQRVRPGSVSTRPARAADVDRARGHFADPD